MGWIDVHTHLNMLKDTDVESVLGAARAAGVSRFITIGTEPENHPIVLEIARRHFPEVGCTLGVHPHEGFMYDDSVEAFIRANAPSPEVVAIGEIGLDYYYEHSPKDRQKDAFRRQIQMAIDLGLPIEIHTRDAEDDTISILSEFAGRLPLGIVHCFTGTMNLARAALDRGLDISISGVVTFKNAHDLREVVKFVPLDRLHVETDAPFLAPVPERGKQNVPAFVVHTARFVAQLKGIAEEELQAATLANARRVFGKMFV